MFEWAKEVADRGAGEILFTSMDHDGTKDGFANDALAKISSEVNIPIIASGGAGNIQHFVDTFTKGISNKSMENEFTISAEKELILFTEIV